MKIGRRVATAVAGAGLTVLGATSAFADVARGEQIYKSHQCSMCHKINGSGGKKGPDLSTVGNTRDATWLDKYLVNPKSLIPKGTMPPAKVTPVELKDLIDYLETLKGAK